MVLAETPTVNVPVPRRPAHRPILLRLLDLDGFTPGFREAVLSELGYAPRIDPAAELALDAILENLLDRDRTETRLVVKAVSNLPALTGGHE